MIASEPLLTANVVCYCVRCGCCVVGLGWPSSDGLTSRKAQKPLQESHFAASDTSLGFSRRMQMITRRKKEEEQFQVLFWCLDGQTIGRNSGMQYRGPTSPKTPTRSTITCSKWWYTTRHLFFYRLERDFRLRHDPPPSCKEEPQSATTVCFTTGFEGLGNVLLYSKISRMSIIVLRTYSR